MLLRPLILCALAALLLAACNSDDEASSDVTAVAEQTARQSEQSTQNQQRQQAPGGPQSEDQEAPDPQSQSLVSAPDQEQTEPDQQSAPADQTDARTPTPPVRTGGPPEPEFDVEIAVGYLNHLAGVLGPRTSGTEQERAAAEYMAEIFSSLGYDVDIQEFTYTTRAEIARIDTADGYSNIAFRFTGSSNDAIDGVLAEVPGIGTADDFASVDVAGKIAILNRGAIEFRVKAAHAESAGVLGLIVVNQVGAQFGGGTFGDYQSGIPVLLVTNEFGDELRSRRGTTASITESSPRGGESQNVIARTPDGVCRVVVGGHYDTVPAVDGANDNASGTALTLALAAIWADHPSANDICFIGFGAEELGLHGSRHYVAELRNQDRLAELTSMLNLDAIGDGRGPYRIIASLELRDLSDATAEDLQINAGSGSLPITLGSDHASFAQVGIPVVFVFPPGAILHTPLDNLDNVDLDLYEDIALLNHGILACLLERAGSPISPSLSCGEE